MSRKPLRRRGNRSRITSSLGADIAQGFDSWGNTISLQTKGWQSQIQRDKFGLEQEAHLSGGVSSRWRRNERGDILSHWVGKPDTPIHFHGVERHFKYEWELDHWLKPSLTQGKIRVEQHLHFS